MTKVYQVLAKTVAAEGCDLFFTLMGNGNMFWSDAMVREQGARAIHARHEHCAVSMAEGYARKTGHVGVASVTCGPGFTQIMTALVGAVRASIPLVIYAGEASMHAPFHIHAIDQGPLAVATGAHFIPLRSKDKMLHDVREAFYLARAERRTVVLSVPEDIQKESFPYPTDYMPSTDLVPRAQRLLPDPVIVDEIADMIAAAKHPVILAGRGAIRSGAGDALRALADQCGALLATSLFGKGLFDNHPFDIGVSGAFATNLAREQFAESDLVIGVGARMGHYTTEGGYLFPNARVVAVDTQPRGLWQGVRVADLHLIADARAAAEAILARLRERRVSGNGARSPALAQRIRGEVPDSKEFPIPTGTVDPRAALRELDSVIPSDWDIVCGVGHYFNFAMTHMRNRPADKYHIIADFGTIGSALPTAIGIAATRGDGKVALIEGDGSILMHIQEFETVKRHGLKFLSIILNDGGYGAEFHKFRSLKMDDSQAMHGRGDLPGIARGFGWRAEKVTTLGRFSALFDTHMTSDGPELWDVHIADNIPSLQYRRIHFGEQ